MSHDVPLSATQAGLAQLNERSREIFRQIVESYLATGEPVGSRNLARIIPMTLSPASVRNVMADLEQLGLIYAPHTSAGRLPTELGLRFFVDALMQIGDLTENDRQAIEAQVAAAGTAKSVEAVLTEASRAAVGPDARGRRGAGGEDRTRGSSTSSSCGSSRSARWWCWSPRTARSRTASSTLPPGLPTSALIEATNFLNARIRGRTLAEARVELERALEAGKAELDQLTQKIVVGRACELVGRRERGAQADRARPGQSARRPACARRPRARAAPVRRSRRPSAASPICSAAPSRPRACASSSARRTSCSRSPAPRPSWRPIATAQGRIVGVLGVIGPTRLNYARIIPMVDYTAKVVSKVLGG